MRNERGILNRRRFTKDMLLAGAGIACNLAGATEILWGAVETVLAHEMAAKQSPHPSDTALSRATAEISLIEQQSARNAQTLASELSRRQFQHALQIRNQQASFLRAKDQINKDAATKAGIAVASVFVGGFLLHIRGRGRR